MDAPVSMSAPEYEAWLHSLVTGAIHGAWRIASDFGEREPYKYPSIDDSILFDVAILLAAAVIDANPAYRDADRFGDGADLAREAFLEQLRHVRLLSEAQARPILFRHIEKATGELPAFHSNH